LIDQSYAPALKRNSPYERKNSTELRKAHAG